jgi:hypothetical protein
MRSERVSLNWRAAILSVLVLAPLVAGAQQCTRRAVIQTDSDVYQSPPRYVTGAGWQGERTDVLPRGTQVLECEERPISFGFSSKIWSRVAYRRASAWSYGWVLQEGLRYVSDERNRPRTTRSAAIAILPVAYQLVAGEPAGQATQWSIPDTAPPPPPSSEGARVATESPINTPTLSEQMGLYWPLFIAMLFGMVAKAAVDLVEEWNKALVVRHLRNGFVAFLVSPIVFLGFLNAGKFDGSQQTFLVLLMLSFQNGFFWQTILKGELRSTPNEAQVSKQNEN